MFSVFLFDGCWPIAIKRGRMGEWTLQNRGGGFLECGFSIFFEEISLFSYFLTENQERQVSSSEKRRARGLMNRPFSPLVRSEPPKRKTRNKFSN